MSLMSYHYSSLSQRHGIEYCLTVYWPDDALKEPKDVLEGWDEMMPTENINLDGYDDRCVSSESALHRVVHSVKCDVYRLMHHARVRHSFYAAKEARRVKYVTRNLIDDWVDETGRIVLLGDAAHPVMVSRTKTSALAGLD